MAEARAHRTVGRVDRILDVVARSTTPPTLTEITRVLDLPRSTVADLLRELREHGYLRVEHRRYRLGYRCHVLGRLAGVGSPTRIDHARLVGLSEIAQAPLALAVLVGAEILYLDAAGPRAPEHLQRIVDDRRPRPALRTAAGRLLLALAGPQDRAVVLQGVLDDPDGGADALAAFERERPAVVHSRIARSDGFADPTMRALAVPVVEDGAVVAAIVLFAPRCDPDSRGRPDPALEQAATRLLAAL